MTVILCHSGNIPDTDQFDRWLVVGDTDHALPADRRMGGIGRRLEAAYKSIGTEWWRLGKALAAEPSATVAHMPTCGAYGSDFGLMMAWELLIQEEAQDEDISLVVCDDPWAFRHFASLPGVQADPPPPLSFVSLKRSVRGVLARIKVTLRVIRAALATRGLVGIAKKNAPVILVYGHPASRADGYDDYFGTLMADAPGLLRMLHTDCNPARASELAKDNRTASLHAFGSVLFALTLVFVRWRPGRSFIEGPHGWLVRRAAALENSGGGPAMNQWQHHCQRRWLKVKRPSVIIWPWENHGWERALSRDARALGIPTVGYQHTTIGPYQYNYSPRCNADAQTELPNLVIANGPATFKEMSDWGVPRTGMVIGGAYRLPMFERALHDPEGPVFMSLSADPHATRTQLAAAKVLADAGFDVVIKEHPMYPAHFTESPRLRRTHQALADMDGIRALVYATGTMGLQGLLAGVPTIRLTLENRFGMDVLPRIARPVESELSGLVDAVRSAEAPTLSWHDILSPIDDELWQNLVRSVKTSQDLSGLIAPYIKKESLPS